jgi:hypothetical protein
MVMRVMTVSPHDVEHGDLLFGRTWRPVDSILLDCSDGQEWVYGDEHGATIARCKVWGTVQVIRDLSGEVEAVPPSPCPAVPSEEAVDPSSTASSLDDCSPRGIARRHGLFVVTP